MLKNFDKTNTENVRVVSNFHTHNYLCGHAGGTVTDYAREAIKHGYKVLGVSDHFASHCDRNPVYITWNNIETDYFTQFDEAEKLFGDKITLLKSVEVAYYEGADDYYRRLQDKLDYVILGQHGYMLDGKRQNSFFNGTDEKNIIAYCRHSIKSLQTRLFTVFAHPDVIFFSNPMIAKSVVRSFDEMIKTAVELDVIVELNANGIRNAGFSYPTDLLTNACLKHNAKVIISSDCHSPNELHDEYVARLYAYAKKMGLNVLDDIRK